MQTFYETLFKILSKRGRAYSRKYDLSVYFGEVINMNIAPKVELSIDKLVTKA